MWKEDVDPRELGRLRGRLEKPVKTCNNRFAWKLKQGTVTNKE